MNIEELRKICLQLPGVKEDVKWGNDLCFVVGDKMFCVTGLEGEFGVSMKVDDEEFEDLTAREGIQPAPYLARYRWVLINAPSAFTKKEWRARIQKSYQLISSKLPAQVKRKLKLL